jgi:hypothetical protein
MVSKSGNEGKEKVVFIHTVDNDTSCDVGHIGHRKDEITGKVNTRLFRLGQNIECNPFRTDTI